MERTWAGSAAGDSYQLRSPTNPPVVLAGRYRLVRRLREWSGAVTWQAFDDVLSRTVVAHVMEPGSKAAAAVLCAARRSALATDSRFLRVLDAMDGDTPFVICESVIGVQLQELLARGALTALESAHIVREIADALAPMHTQGVFHRRLDPQTITITRSGNVKISGFLIDAALNARTPEPAPSWREQEAADVRAMGKLLYACLVARWPIDLDLQQTRQWGLIAAPLTSPAVSGERRWVPPATLSSRVPAPLDAICMQILTPHPGSEALRTAEEVDTALARVLGSAAADDQLEHRVALLISSRGTHTDDPPVRWRTVEDKPAPTAVPGQRPVTVGVDATPTRTLAAVPPRGVPPVHRRPMGTPGGWHPDVEPQAQPSDIDTHRRPRAKPSRAYRLGRWLIPLFVIVMVVVSVTGMLHSCESSLASLPATGQRTHSGSGAPSGASAALAGAPQSVTEFDPVADGGEGHEMPSEVRLATDGNPATAWHTQEYWNSAAMGGLKPGTGLVLDLGAVSTIGAVHLALVGAPTGIQLMVPADDSHPSTTSVKDWKVVAVEPAAPESVTLAPDTPLTTRHLLVYVTSLPKLANGHFQAGVAEIEVNP